MNVLTNESIKDPTAVENRVKREIQQRVDKHLAQNEARKLTKEQKHEKLWNKQEKIWPMVFILQFTKLTS